MARLMNIYDMSGVRRKSGGCCPRRLAGAGAQRLGPGQHTWNHGSPWDRRPKNPIGYEMFEVSRVRVTQAGDISVLDIIRDRTEVKPGDFILPVSDMGYDSVFYPSAMDSVPDGLRVLATSGQQSVSACTRSCPSTVAPTRACSRVTCFPHSDRADVEDRTGYRWGSFSTEAEVRLPDVYDGLVMVFRTFDDISYGMVMSGQGGRRSSTRCGIRTSECN